MKSEMKTIVQTQALRFKFRGTSMTPPRIILNYKGPSRLVDSFHPRILQDYK